MKSIIERFEQRLIGVLNDSINKKPFSLSQVVGIENCNKQKNNNSRKEEEIYKKIDDIAKRNPNHNKSYFRKCGQRSA